MVEKRTKTMENLSTLCSLRNIAAKTKPRPAMLWKCNTFPAQQRSLRWNHCPVAQNTVRSSNCVYYLHTIYIWCAVAFFQCVILRPICINCCVNPSVSQCTDFCHTYSYPYLIQCDTICRPSTSVWLTFWLFSLLPTKASNMKLQVQFGLHNANTHSCTRLNLFFIALFIDQHRSTGLRDKETRSPQNIGAFFSLLRARSSTNHVSYVLRTYTLTHTYPCHSEIIITYAYMLYTWIYNTVFFDLSLHFQSLNEANIHTQWNYYCQMIYT